MTTPASTKKSRNGGWFISSPGFGGTLPLSQQGTVTITVNDNGDKNLGYRAGLYDPADPPTPYDQCTPMSTSDGDIYTANLTPPDPGNEFRVIVYVEGGPGDYQTDPFVISGSGSGSGSPSGSGYAFADHGAFVVVRSLGASVPRTLYAHISNPDGSAFEGKRPHKLVHDRKETAWIADGVGGCGPRGFRLASLATKMFLTVKGPKTFNPAVAQSGPVLPFQIIFTGVTLPTSDGGTATVNVEILLSAG